VHSKSNHLYFGVVRNSRLPIRLWWDGNFPNTEVILLHLMTQAIPLILKRSKPKLIRKSKEEVLTKLPNQRRLNSIGCPFTVRYPSSIINRQPKLIIPLRLRIVATFMLLNFLLPLLESIVACCDSWHERLQPRIRIQHGLFVKSFRHLCYCLTLSFFKATSGVRKERNGVLLLRRRLGCGPLNSQSELVPTSKNRISEDDLPVNKHLRF